MSGGALLSSTGNNQTAALFVNGAGKANTFMGAFPPNAIAIALYIWERSGNNVTVAIGTTLGGSDVTSGLSVTGNGTETYNFETPNWFSASLPQPLFLTFSNNNALIDVSLVYQLKPGS